MRPPCIDCTRKHVAQASVLLDESRTGTRRTSVSQSGHKARNRHRRSKSEARGLNLGIEKEIRQARIAIQEGEDPDLLRFIVKLTDLQKAGKIRNDFEPDYVYWDEHERGMQRGTLNDEPNDPEEPVVEVP